MFVWLLVVAFITSLFLAATPRLFNEMSDDGLRHEVRDASPIRRNVSVARHSRIAAGGDDDAFGGVRRGGERFLESELPASLQSLIIGETYVVESPRFVASPFPGEPGWPFSAFVRVRYQQDVGEHVRLVAGTLPKPQPAVPVVLEEDAETRIRERLLALTTTSFSNSAASSSRRSRRNPIGTGTSSSTVRS